MNPLKATHPSREQLAAFTAGKMNAVESDEIEQHLSECDSCCHLLTDLPDEDTLTGLLKDDTSVSPEAESFARTIVPEPKASTNAPHAEATLVPEGDTAGPPLDLPQELREHARYRIVRLIGRGGMGDVYEAEHRVMNRPVALKVIKPKLVRNDAAVRRFHREVQAAARLRHPNIVTAFDAEQAGDLHYLVMEFVDGVDLDQVIKERGPLPVEQACDYIRQAAEGLQHAHELGMVHRDIKPHNLMIEEPQGTLVCSGKCVKILDFGLANFANETAAEEIEHADSQDQPLARAEVLNHLTQAGTMMGTPDYIAPEQAKDAHTADIRSDIYSLGCTLYTLLTGKTPFSDGSVLEKIKAHTEADAPPISEFRDDVPEEIAAVLNKMMAKDPAERYQTPSEVAEALRQVSGGRKPAGLTHGADAGTDRRLVRSPETHGADAGTDRRLVRSLGFRRKLVTVVGGLIAALIAFAVYYIQTDYGVVRIEVADDSLEVQLVGETVTAKDGEKEISIRPGEQKLYVKRGDFGFYTDSFELRRGDEISLKVDLSPGEIVVSKDGEGFDSEQFDAPRIDHNETRSWKLPIRRHLDSLASAVPGDSSDEIAEWIDQNDSLLLSPNDPATRAALKLVGRLSPEDRERLLSDGYLKWPYEKLDSARQEGFREAVQSRMFPKLNAKLLNPETVESLVKRSLENGVGFVVTEIPNSHEAMIGWFPASMAIPLFGSSAGLTKKYEKKLLNWNRERIEAVLNKPNSPLPERSELSSKVLLAQKRVKRISLLKQIGVMLQMYHVANGSLPPAADFQRDNLNSKDKFDAEGRPHLSWRVYMLPMLNGGKELFEQFHLDEPWDSEHNIKLLDQMPAVFKTTDDPTKTTFLAVVGEGTAYEGKAGLAFKDITDGVANTALIVDAGAEKAVPWTKPEDLPFDSEDPIRAFGESDFGNIFLALKADGSVNEIAYDTAPEQHRNLFLRADGNELDLSKKRDEMSLPESGPGKISLLHELPSYGAAHGRWVDAVAFPSNDEAISISGDGEVRVWNPESGEQVGNAFVMPGAKFAISADGRYLASATSPNRLDQQGRSTIEYWDRSKRKAVWQQKVEGGVHQVEVTPHGVLVTTTAESGHVWLLDLGTGEVRHRLAEGGRLLGKSALSPGGDRLFVRTPEGRETAARILRIEDGATLAKLDCPDRYVESAVWSRDGRHVLGGTADGRIRVWKAETGELKQFWPADPLRVQSLVLGPDDLLYAGGARRITVWDWSQPVRLVATVDAPQLEGLQIAIAPDGRRMISGGGKYVDFDRDRRSNDHAPRIWKLPESVWPRQEVSLEGEWQPVSVEQNGQRVPKVALERIQFPERFIFRGNRWGVVTPDGKTYESTFEIDWSRSPATIDVTGSLFENMPNIKGILKSDGDMLTVCYVENGKPRPTGFITEGHPEWYIVRARRISKSPPAEGRARDELETKSKQSVKKGLNYLAKVQHEDGHWEAKNPKESAGTYPVAMTALAGMTMLMEGSTLEYGLYSDNLQRAVNWLIAQSQEDGRIAFPLENNYRYMFGHGYAMLFLSSVYHQEPDGPRKRKLEEILTKAVLFTEIARTPRGGWGYVTAAEGNNFDEAATSITQLQALRAARNAGIHIPRGLIDAEYLRKFTGPTGGVVYTLGSKQLTERPALTSAALAGCEYDAELFKKWLQFAQKNLPLDGQRQTGHRDYAHYYYAQAMYILGDDGYGKLFPESKPADRLTWSRYRESVFDEIIDRQEADGSWSDNQVGPVYGTACSLTVLLLDNDAVPIYRRASAKK